MTIDERDGYADGAMRMVVAQCMLASLVQGLAALANATSSGGSEEQGDFRRAMDALVELEPTATGWLALGTMIALLMLLGRAKPGVQTRAALVASVVFGISATTRLLEKLDHANLFLAAPGLRARAMQMIDGLGALEEPLFLAGICAILLVAAGGELSRLQKVKPILLLVATAAPWLVMSKLGRGQLVAGSQHAGQWAHALAAFAFAALISPAVRAVRDDHDALTPNDEANAARAASGVRRIGWALMTRVLVTVAFVCLFAEASRELERFVIVVGYAGVLATSMWMVDGTLRLTSTPGASPARSSASIALGLMFLDVAITMDALDSVMHQGGDDLAESLVLWAIAAALSLAFVARSVRFSAHDRGDTKRRGWARVAMTAFALAALGALVLRIGEASSNRGTFESFLAPVVLAMTTAAFVGAVALAVSMWSAARSISLPYARA